MSLPKTGVVVKTYGGFCYIAEKDNSTEHSQLIEATLRGRLKLEQSKLPPVIVGDIVEYEFIKSSPVITKVYPRKTKLFRPPVANINQVVLVAAAGSPPPDLLLLDKILVQAEANGIDVLVVINKVDKAQEKVLTELQKHFSSTDYSVICSSAIKGIGLDKLAQALVGRFSVLAGPSGVGKSSLIKGLVPDYQGKVQSVSAKTERGRHTTRHVELLSLPLGGYLADTPGFSQISVAGIDVQQLPGYFPEFNQFSRKCRFTSCLHGPEPGCKVKEALENGIISRTRYANYCQILAEIKALKKW